MDKQLFWPPADKWWESILSCWILMPSPVWIFFPVLIWGLMQRYKICPILIKERQRTKEITKSVLLEDAKYVGGHPLIPNATSVLLGVSESNLTIYSVGSETKEKTLEAFIKRGLEIPKLEDYRISTLANIPLIDIFKVGAGRPKTAREIYDEDHGYTIDVYERSPFLSIIFSLSGHTYAMSFQSFKTEGAPQTWANQIVALQYKARNNSR